MNELQITGGARIGRANATFPFATLKVNKDRLDLNASILGNLTFQSSDIISIEPYTMIPILGQGVKINHNVPTYKDRVIFWTFKDPVSVVRQIQGTGFLNKESVSNQNIDRTIIKKQSKGGFPIKKSFAIGAIVVWNLLFLSDIIPFMMGKAGDSPVGKGVFAAISLLFLSALLSLISAGFRRLILKDGRELSDIKRLAFLLLIISGFMLFQFVVFTRLINKL